MSKSRKEEELKAASAQMGKRYSVTNAVLGFIRSVGRINEYCTRIG